MSDIKCYGIAINTEECFNDLMTGKKKMDKVAELAGIVAGIYQDHIKGYQILVFTKAKDRDKAYKHIETIGFEDFCKVDDFYVDKRYLKE